MESFNKSNSPIMNKIMGMPENTYCMLLHLSQLLIFALPGIGAAAPFVLWVIKKDKSPLVDRHGKIILNWLISAFIYTIAGGILALVGIGFIVLAAVPIAMFAFAVIGGVKANDGIVWEYRVFNCPVSIKFLK